MNYLFAEASHLVHLDIYVIEVPIVSLTSPNANFACKPSKLGYLAMRKAPMWGHKLLEEENIELVKERLSALRMDDNSRPV